MAVVTILSKATILRSEADIKESLGRIGIDYERWESRTDLSREASDEEILKAYDDQIEALKQRGGYVSADVINVGPSTPDLDDMLARFNKEHWHDEDEVRYIVKGHGLFHISSPDGEVVSILMEAGDLIRVPRGTHHWFDLCSYRTIRAIRLFQNTEGWTPHYTDSGVDTKYQPLCFSDAALSQS